MYVKRQRYKIRQEEIINSEDFNSYLASLILFKPWKFDFFNPLI